jgi:hypothetical protein
MSTSRVPDFFIPSQDQWCEAAYFSPEIGEPAGYSVYAIQSNAPPANNPTAGASGKANLANNFVLYDAQPNTL